MTPASDMVGHRAPVFVRALGGRSGTNHLSDLLAAHPDLVPVAMPEDNLTAGAEMLEGYARRVSRFWGIFDHELAEPARYTSDSLLERLGEGLMAHLTGDPGRSVPADKRPLLKSPSLDAPHMTFRLFPGARLLILLRDPRSIAESYRRSHWWRGDSLEAQGAHWAQRARALGDFLAANQEALRRGQIRLVRYERLVEDPAGALEALFAHLGLPADAGAVERARAAPVIGSSFLARTAAGQVDFTPQPRPADFDPRCRWAHWSAQEHRRFNRVCGAQMRRWGYEPAG